MAQKSGCFHSHWQHQRTMCLETDRTEGEADGQEMKEIGKKGAALEATDCLLPAHHRANLLVGSLDSTLGSR